MRIYIIQYKLARTGMVCSPTVRNTFVAAQEFANTLIACGSVYTGVQIVSMRIPAYKGESDSTVLVVKLS